MVKGPVVKAGAPDSRDESGFTILEVCVALMLLAIVAAPLGSVFWVSVRTAGVANHRTEAAAISSREIESMRAVPYAEVGFFGDQTGFVSNFEGNTTVQLASSTPANTIPQVQPQQPDSKAAVGFLPDPIPANASPVVQLGVKYTIQRYVVWINAKDASQTYTQAYKRLTVIATWTDVAGTHNAREDSILYPGGQGLYVGPEGIPTTTTSSTTVATPTAPVLNTPTVPADPMGETEIDLTWSQPTGGAALTGYTVVFATDAAFTTPHAVNGISASATSYPVTSGLASGTKYYFKVTANAATQTADSNVQSATTLTPPLPVCTLGPLVVTGATTHSTTGTILSNGSGKMGENLTLGFSTTGTCTDSYQVKGLSPSGATDQLSPYALINGGSGHYTATILSSGQKNWAIGTHTFTVWDVTNGAATNVVKTFNICASGSASC